MGKDIFLTNSLDNKKNKFIPKNEKSVGMYVCGPTVYDDPHIGNARPLVVFDILFKILKKKYGSNSVKYIRNITDIDDKIIKASNDKKISIKDLTLKISESFHDDCKYLKCEQPTEEPRATENINQMVDMITDLENQGYAYSNNNHVYFEVNKFEDYGKLSNKKLDELIAGSRVEVSEFKKNPEDFVLWKPSTADEPSWDSPWGKGRPGWHLECSAMSKRYLGDEFDIHGGGRDLIFPHHENEIAQSRCANGTKSFANYWVHNGFITLSNEKMAKSQGNILKIKDFKTKYNGQVLRLALITSHYRQGLDWNDKLISECEKTLTKWYSAHIEVKEKITVSEDILSPLYDDLNTPGYIANLHSLYSKASSGTDEDKNIFVHACNFIGLLTDTKEEWMSFKKNSINISEDEIRSKIEERNKARSDKNYELADKIRQDLLDKGILIEDKDGTTSWKLK